MAAGGSEIQSFWLHSLWPACAMLQKCVCVCVYLVSEKLCLAWDQLVTELCSISIAPTHASDTSGQFTDFVIINLSAHVYM